MAILPMKRVDIYALLKDRKLILNKLQQLGSVQLDNLQEDECFVKNDITEDLSIIEREIAMVDEALRILDSHVPEKKSILNSLKGRQELTLEAYEELTGKQNEFCEVAKRIISLDRRIAECIAEMHRLQVHIDALAPWSKLDVALHFQGTRFTSVFIGTLPGEVSMEQLLIEMAHLIPQVEATHVDIISKSKEQTCIFVLCHRKDAVAVEGALRAMGFARPSVSASKLPPAKQKSELEAELKALVQDIQDAKVEIASYSKQRENLKFLFDWLAMKLERLEKAGDLLESKRILYLSGYVPEREANKVTSALKNRFTVHIEFKDPDPEDDVPILLENNKFVEPVEGVLASFSYPGKGEIDPSAVMSIFYYILFGLMLSDAALVCFTVFAVQIHNGAFVPRVWNIILQSMGHRFDKYYCLLLRIYPGYWSLPALEILELAEKKPAESFLFKPTLGYDKYVPIWR
jgi:V/A-type H+-transporting ATPase subunit I